MKITAIIAALILLQLSTKAQTIKYDTCHYLQQYEGEWRQISGQDTISSALVRASRIILHNPLCTIKAQ